MGGGLQQPGWKIKSTRVQDNSRGHPTTSPYAMLGLAWAGLDAHWTLVSLTLLWAGLSGQGSEYS
jgi:hypothetical protein